MDEKGRKSWGQRVRDTAIHYYEGLANISTDLASEQFRQRLSLNDPLALSALRLAENEILVEVISSIG